MYVLECMYLNMYLRQDWEFGQRRNPGTCPVQLPRRPPPIVSFSCVSCVCGEQRCGPAFCDSVPHSTSTGLIQPHPQFSQSLPFLYPLIAAYPLPPSLSFNQWHPHRHGLHVPVLTEIAVLQQPLVRIPS